MPFDIASARIVLGIDATVNSHKPVMLKEALAGLALRSDGFYLDGTFGRGGHSAAILEQLGPEGRLLALDQDPQAVAHAQARFADEPRFSIRHCNFAELASAVHAQFGARGADGILLDLGVSSPQLDDAQRGFSFSKDGPLDMRMNPQAGESAAAWLARAREEEIADVLWQYGEERNSRRIARRIVETRGATPLTGTAQLAALIASVPGPRSRTIHPATRSFQAIRIYINRELEVLRSALAQAVDALAPGGRLVVISFHSLEDRIVKHFLRDAARAEVPRLKLHGKQFPDRDEERENPRARSAVLRIAEKLEARA
ncbi:16S rRNA (cytosine1402-N4)-methyltransferase [Solimonas aquatica]|uniref:Ribosomal RNA small subunit methyltransferase H n=1 Tax=Solimonas aquatica TaxID=489703 RepID=A0A1H9K182_9GAMM|nr:16S rRNA (cytosine(1402)-N(4))-methyltransferase RsmH [Solimonas aquatica]SEQ92882.1 16S rRNA (cytosine1402-N4)-methyltransferase [Solimonas aquatica]